MALVETFCGNGISIGDDFITPSYSIKRHKLPGVKQPVDEKKAARGIGDQAA